jgi:hypothetical protein
VFGIVCFCFSPSLCKQSSSQGFDEPAEGTEQARDPPSREGIWESGRLEEESESSTFLLCEVDTECVGVRFMQGISLSYLLCSSKSLPQPPSINGASYAPGQTMQEVIYCEATAFTAVANVHHATTTSPEDRCPIWGSPTSSSVSKDQLAVFQVHLLRTPRTQPLDYHQRTRIHHLQTKPNRYY